MRREGAELSRLAQAVLSRQAAASDEGVAIYRYGFEARTRRLLEKTFPATSQALGSRWPRLGAEYAYGPMVREPNLNLAGRELPRFLAGRVSDALAELARLEWSLVSAAMASRGPAVGLDSLRDRRRYRFQPDVSWLRLTWNSLARLKAPTARARRSSASAPICVFRSQHGPTVRPVSPRTFRLALALEQGVPLADAVVRAGPRLEELSRVFAWWARDGLLLAAR